MKIEIRQACPSDAPLIAWVVQTALDIEGPASENIIKVCADLNTLYSWQHTLIVSVDGVDAGALIAYNGKDYMAQRNDTWQRCWPETTLEEINKEEIETVPGEYYLDSMALKPAYRGLGLGKQLLLKGISKAKEQHCSQATLLVAVDKPLLQAYYEKIGFEVYGHMNFFGHEYNRMKVVCHESQQ